MFAKGSLHGYWVLHTVVKKHHSHREYGGRASYHEWKLQLVCVVVGEPGAVFEVVREEREGSPEAGIHELK